MENEAAGLRRSPRQNAISWKDYFMGLAFLSAQRSKDPKFPNGACIVNEDKRIVGLGYNGMPNNCSDDEFLWDKLDASGDTYHNYVVHAEANAILNRNSTSLKNCVIYTTQFPCTDCAKLIVQSGIRKVVFILRKEDRPIENQAVDKMFKHADILPVRYTSDIREVFRSFI